MHIPSKLKSLTLHNYLNFILTSGITFWLCHFLLTPWISILIALVVAILEGMFFHWTNYHFKGRYFINFLDNVMYWPGLILWGNNANVKVARWFICIAVIPTFLVWKNFVFHDFANSSIATLITLLLLSNPIQPIVGTGIRKRTS